jgi:tetratricopeptide (TPR) repeat protein
LLQEQTRKPDYSLNEGLRLYSLSDYANAIVYLDKAINMYKHAGDKEKFLLALNCKAACLDLVGRYCDALRCYDEEFRDDDPGEFPAQMALAYHNKGYSLGNLERYEEAVHAFNKAIHYFDKIHNEARDPIDEANIYRNQGMAIVLSHYYAEEIRLGSDVSEYSKANECLERATEIAPNFALAWNTKGYIHTLFGKYKEAVSCFDRAIEIDPTFALALRNQGYTHYSIARERRGGHDDSSDNEKVSLDSAMQFFDRSLRIDSENPYVWHYRGFIPFEQERYEEALDNFEISLKKGPRYADAYYSKGFCCQLLERYDEAKKCFERAIELYEEKKEQGKNKEEHWKKPDYKKLAYAYYGKGLSLDSLGGFVSHANAIGCFNQAMKIYQNIENQKQKEKKSVY